MDERVKAKQAELEYLWDRDVSYDEAFHEVVADSMQKLFNDGNLQNELVKLKQSSPEGARVVQAIKDFLDKLIKRIRNIYSKLKTGSKDAEAVAQMGGSLRKLQKIFAAALVEASDNYTAYGAVDKNAKISSSEAQFQARKKSNKTDFNRDFDYSALNWATDLGIITGKDRAIFERTINNEILRGAKPLSANGEYIIDTGKCLMFTDGDFYNPTLSLVIEFETEYESLTADAKEWIINEAKTTGDIQESIALIKTGFGPEFVSLHYAPDGTTNGGQSRGGKGSNRGGTYQKTRSLKERLADEGIFFDEDTQFQARGKSVKSPYDGKILYQDSDVYTYSFMTALDPMVVATMPNLTSVKTGDNVDQSKAVDLGLKNAATIGRKVGTNQYAIKNNYTKREVILGSNGLDHSLDADNKYRLRTNARLSAIGGEIVRNAVPINGLKKKNQQVNGTYAMAAFAFDGKSYVVAIVTVDEFTSSVVGMDYVDIAHSINGRRQKNIGDSRSASRAPELGPMSLPATAISNINIDDFLEIVNSTHRSILSNDVLSHFNEERP